MTSFPTRWGSRLGVAPRRWLARRTLRGRLITGLVTLLALACATVGLATGCCPAPALAARLPA